MMSFIVFWSSLNVDSPQLQLFLFHTFFDNVKRAQVDEIRRQHAEACAKLLLEEEHNKKANKKTTYVRAS
jgi:hypothetical protein